MLLSAYKNIAAFVVLPILIILALLYFFEMPIKEFEEFLHQYSGTILAIGTLVLISALAVFTAHLSNAAADRREKYNRSIQAELQIAKFRQEWIGEMRNDLAEFLQIMFQEVKRRDISRAYYLQSKVYMRLNHEEELASKLSDDLVRLVTEDLTGERPTKEASALVSSSRAYLKNEWRRLKEDIKKAQLLESDIV